jgi:F0F1-type ATP synthase assembly protein I
VQGLFDDETDETGGNEPTADSAAREEPFVLSDYPSQSTAETVRQTGLAWSAGIAFFGAIVFMLFLGWLFDLLVGASPWGIVGGIVLGSIIGFMQFFRITRQIFQPNMSTPAEKPLPLSETPDYPRRRDRFDEP